MRAESRARIDTNSGTTPTSADTNRRCPIGGEFHGRRRAAKPEGNPTHRRCPFNSMDQGRIASYGWLATHGESRGTSGVTSDVSAIRDGYNR